MKPCPFCGGIPHALLRMGWRMVCNSCGAQTDTYDTDAEAIEAWDRRFDPAAPAAPAVGGKS